MGFSGILDVEAAQRAAKDLKAKATAIESLTGAIGSTVDKLSSAWVGGDATRFRSSDWPAQKKKLSALRVAIDDLGDELNRQIAEQAKASAADGVEWPGDGGNKNPVDYPDKPGNVEGKGDADWRAVPDNLGTSPSDMDPYDVGQRGIGDCWFIAGLMGMADADPEFLSNHISFDPETGDWTVILYDKKGNPVPINIGSEVTTAGAGDTSGQVNWVSLYERALAECYGNDYANIPGGFGENAFELITGKPADKYGELNFDKIEELLEKGPVTAGSEPESKVLWIFGDKVDDPRVVANHEYWVAGIEEVDGVRMIHLVNPWGSNWDSIAGSDNSILGELWLTEEEYKQNFDEVSAVDLSKG
ncbi:MAG: hypothetical protein LBR19_06765 [Bifidobacteriaceae bacterium]|nr:hypothetical protein [Bifidobacteriaceae bacterium]